MIFVDSRVRVKDNTGVKRAKCLRVYGRDGGKVGDTVLVVVNRVLPRKKIKTGDKLKMVLIASSSKVKRPLSFVSICFSATAGVFLKKGDIVPFSNRILSKIAREVRFAGYYRLFFISRGTI